MSLRRAIRNANRVTNYGLPVPYVDREGLRLLALVKRGLYAETPLQRLLRSEPCRFETHVIYDERDEVEGPLPQSGAGFCTVTSIDRDAPTLTFDQREDDGH